MRFSGAEQSFEGIHRIVVFPAEIMLIARLEIRIGEKGGRRIFPHQFLVGRRGFHVSALARELVALLHELLIQRRACAGAGGACV